jgi:hypothetical protein
VIDGSPFIGCTLRETLKNWSKRYTRSDKLQTLIINQTMLRVAAGELSLYANNAERALLRILHSVATKEVETAKLLMSRRNMVPCTVIRPKFYQSLLVHTNLKNAQIFQPTYEPINVPKML